MATRIWNKSWADEQSLEEAVRNYNSQGQQRKEILSFMVRDFGEYAQSLQSLDRRLSDFNIHRNNKNVSIDNAKSAFNKNQQDQLGYQATMQYI